MCLYVRVFVTGCFKKLMTDFDKVIRTDSSRNTRLTFLIKMYPRYRGVAGHGVSFVCHFMYGQILE